MKELLEMILKNLVDNPDDIKVEEVAEEEDPTFVKLMITANDEDKGLIIGKGGRTIGALRNVVGIKAVKESKKVRLELID